MTRMVLLLVAFLVSALPLQAATDHICHDSRWPERVTAERVARDGARGRDHR